MHTNAKEFIRDMNSNLIFETIINSAPMTRADLSKELGLTKTMITNVVNEFIKKKLLLEIDTENIFLGRKDLLLRLNYDAGYALCIDVGVSVCTALLTNLRGEKYKIETMPTPNDIAFLSSKLISLIIGLTKDLPATPYGLVGITLSIHGVTHDNQILFAPYYELAQYNLSATIGVYFNTPVYLENEANLSALGESTFVYDSPNIASISVHSGVGLGLIMNNRIYTGFGGYAGEFGHTIIELDGRPCPCGNNGCLEQYVSEVVLMNEFAQAKGLPTMEFKEFIPYYQSGDADALLIMDKFTKYMTLGLNNILNAYNPEMVIINSSFTMYFPEITKELEASLTCRMNDYLYLLPSTLQGTSALLGGVSLVIKNFLGVKYLSFQSKTAPSII